MPAVACPLIITSSREDMGVLSVMRSSAANRNYKHMELKRSLTLSLELANIQKTSPTKTQSP
ncbi:MAG: hypothetical protein D6674_06175 [Acidobacteria bacterium]|nr:MAG: hypothetical protein D6674_06175 [Acidobacteriota bacterium]